MSFYLFAAVLALVMLTAVLIDYVISKRATLPPRRHLKDQVITLECGHIYECRADFPCFACLYEERSAAANARARLAGGKEINAPPCSLRPFWPIFCNLECEAWSKKTQIVLPPVKQPGNGPVRIEVLSAYALDWPPTVASTWGSLIRWILEGMVRSPISEVILRPVPEDPEDRQRQATSVEPRPAGGKEKSAT